MVRYITNIELRERFQSNMRAWASDPRNPIHMEIVNAINGVTGEFEPVTAVGSQDLATTTILTTGVGRR